MQLFVQTPTFALLYFESKSFVLSRWELGKVVQVLLGACLIELI